MSGILFYKEFNDLDLDDSNSPLRRKFDVIIKDLEENKYTSLGSVNKMLP
ncbi:hypothetical protein [Wolbachia endosymbiont (group E) of Neria commutata]